MYTSPIVLSGGLSIPPGRLKTLRGHVPSRLFFQALFVLHIFSFWDNCGIPFCLPFPSHFPSFFFICYCVLFGSLFDHFLPPVWLTFPPFFLQFPLFFLASFWLPFLARNNTKKQHFPNIRTLSSYAPCQCLLKVRPLAHRPTFYQNSFLFSSGKTSNFPPFSSPVALQTAIHKNTPFFINFGTTAGSYFCHFCLPKGYPKTCLKLVTLFITFWTILAPKWHPQNSWGAPFLPPKIGAKIKLHFFSIF